MQQLKSAGLLRGAFDWKPLASAIVGTEGDDSLQGTAEADVIKGLGGSDLIFGLDGADKLYGGAGDDAIQGGRGADKLYGEAGDDYLSGGADNDVFDGGDGFDRVGFFDAAAGAHVSLLIAGPQDTGVGMDTLTKVENLSGSAQSDSLIGDNAANWLWGSSGGHDTLVGNGGNDLLTVAAGDHLLQGGAGVDTVQIDDNSLGVFPNGAAVDLNIQGLAQDTGLGMMTLTGIENLSGTTLADAFTGSNKANALAGGDDSDVLSGGGGSDALYGDGVIAADTAPFGASGPIATFAWLAPDEFFSGGDDVLDGGVGKDTLVGGVGQDQMTGGAGVDLFVFYALEDSEIDRPDLITDLTKLDIIDLSRIDADAGADGDQAFSLVKKFGGHAGELMVKYDAGLDVTHIMLDVDGDKEADAVIDAAGKVKFDHFVL